MTQAISNSKVINALVQKHTAFPSFIALLTAEGDYRPTFHTEFIDRHSTREDLERRAELRVLADLYDEQQAYLGDPRRAYRS